VAKALDAKQKKKATGNLLVALNLFLLSKELPSLNIKSRISLQVLDLKVRLSETAIPTTLTARVD
jgi:hypothetical protein